MERVQWIFSIHLGVQVTMSIAYIVVGATLFGTYCNELYGFLSLSVYIFVYGCVTFLYALIVGAILIAHIKNPAERVENFYCSMAVLFIIYSIVWLILCVGVRVGVPSQCDDTRTAMIVLIPVNAIFSLFACVPICYIRWGWFRRD